MEELIEEMEDKGLIEEGERRPRPPRPGRGEGRERGREGGRGGGRGEDRDRNRRN